MENEVTQLVDDSGNFTEVFNQRLPEFLGEGYEDFKGFDGVDSVGKLAKMYADTKRMVGKKMENVIQKPGENATDEEKAAYRQSLRGEMGVPETADAYEINLDDVKEFVQFADDDIQSVKTAFHEAGLSTEAAGKVMETYKGIIAKQVEAQREAAQQQFIQESDALKKSYPGERLNESARIGFTAMQEFMDDDFKAQLKEAGVFENPANLENWAKVGISPSQLAVWMNIGKRMKSAPVMNSTGGGGDPSAREAAQKMYPNSPELWPKQ